MRKLLLTLGLVAGVAPAAVAQDAWRPEIGIRSVFGQVDVDGTNVTLIDLPAGSGIEGYGANASLYGVIPVGRRFAVEPSLGFSDVSAAGTTATTVNAGGRVLYSAWRKVYLAAGPSLSLIKSDGEELTRWGGQVAAGYRFHVSGAVDGRAELFYSTLGKNDDFGLVESNEIGLAVSLGMGLGERPAPRGARGARADRMWDLALGVQGGYSHASFPGQVEITNFSLPGTGGEGGLFGVPLPQLAPWFVQIPVGERFALEPSFGYHRFDIEDGPNGSMYTLGLRGDYAFNRTFYGAVSGELLGVGGDSFDGVDGMTGLGFATGVRFPLVAGLKARTELSYRVFTGGDSAVLPDNQVTSLSFALLAPLR